MKTIAHRIVLIGLLWLMGLTVANAASFTGVARSLEDDSVLYEERHELVTDEQGLPIRETVDYVTPDGLLLARKTMRYREPARPAYEIELKTRNRTERVEPDADGVDVRSRKSGRIDWPDQPAVIDGGFHYFILANFDQLLAGDSVRFQFLAPTRLTWTALEIEPGTRRDDRLTLTLRLQNPVLNWLLDPIELVYDAESRRLLEYRGLTNLPRPDDGNYRARILYTYDPEPS